MAELKEDILRRAQEVSDEEEEWVAEDEQRRQRRVPFVEGDELDDIDAGPRIKIGGEGEDVDDQEHVSSTASCCYILP